MPSRFRGHAMQFPSYADQLALRDAVFDIGLFAVTDWDPERDDEGSLHGAEAVHGQQQQTHGQSLGGSEGTTRAERVAAAVSAGPRTAAGDALQVFAGCVASGRLDGLLRTVTLGGGSGATRTTLATATNGSVPLPLPLLLRPSVTSRTPGSEPISEAAADAFQRERDEQNDLGGEGVERDGCPDLALPAAALRRAVDGVGRAYARLLDRLVHGATARWGHGDGSDQWGGGKAGSAKSGCGRGLLDLFRAVTPPAPRPPTPPSPTPTPTPTPTP